MICEFTLFSAQNPLNYADLLLFKKALANPELFPLKAVLLY